MNIPLPTFIDAEAWAEFVAARKHIKKPLTQGAAERQLKRLYAIRDAGHDANEALRYSADHYYQDVYPAKELEIERKAGAAGPDPELQRLNERARTATKPPPGLRRVA